MKTKEESNSMKKSDILYEEIKELEKKVLKIKLISKKESIGKVLKDIHIGDVGFWDRSETGILTVFDDGTALFLCDGDCKVSLHFIYRSYYIVGEEGDFFLSFTDKEGNPLYVNIDILKEILKKAEEMEKARHQESIKEKIQKHLDEISSLKEQL